MSVANLSWLYAAVGILALLLNIALLFTKWSQYPRSTKYALGGLGLILLAQIGPQIVMMLVGQFATSSSFVLYSVVAAFGGSLVHFAGLCLLIAAVYADRNYNSAEPLGIDPDGRKSARAADSNPYVV